ncbi:MAG: metallophosphoesterase [Vicinamibacteria bacterium]|nr:metallophosphoesterase [Vicinamibacteria bacterium]
MLCDHAPRTRHIGGSRLRDSKETIAVVGDVHGHLQMALCVFARWQRDLGRPFSAVLLCGDVGTFTNVSQLDNATRRHARDNPCEIEFLTQWCANPPAAWLARIFTPIGEGLGLTCPVVMVHGNHEGFGLLEEWSRQPIPANPVAVEKLPAIDPNGYLKYLPSGWRFETSAGHVVAGIGGIEPGQRVAAYHPMAFIDESAVLALASYSDTVDILVSHQGPSLVQGALGSPTLDLLAENPMARVWCHGHGVTTSEITTIGPGGECRVVPLGDIAFSDADSSGGRPGLDGWLILDLHGEKATIRREPPRFWRQYRKSRWRRTRTGCLICPDLLPFVDHRELAD